MEEKRLLITGGSGFIGRQVIPLALEFGYRVLNVDLKRPPTQSIVYASAIADVRDHDQITRLFDSFAPTHVLHLASDTDITLSKPEEFTTVTIGSRVVFDAVARQSSVRRSIHVSTQYVLKPGMQPKDEQHYRPYTVYGEAKAESERALWASGLENWTIVRPTIVWGPHHPTFADQLWKYMERRQYLHPASRQPIIRNYGYVENVAEQMLRLLNTPAIELDRRVYYLGDMNVDYSIWANAFSRALTGHDARRVPKSTLLVLGALGQGAAKLGFKFPFNMGRYHRMTTASPLDLENTYKVTGLPSVPFEIGVERTVSWLREYWRSDAVAPTLGKER